MARPSWTSLRIIPGENRDGVIAALFKSGSQGVLEDGASLVTHFPPEVAVDPIRTAIQDADPGAMLDISSAPAPDHSTWRASVSAHRLGRLVIAPPWLASEFDPAITIVVDPAMAFGTGEHPTTRGVVRLMQGVIRPGDVVADLGAGSAVLSIAAARLGASRVAAIEMDHDAIENAEENVRANDVADRVEVIEGDAVVLLPLLAPVRVVLANIISSVLIPLLPVLRESLTGDGQAILSGILHEERDELVAALDAGGWAIEREDVEDGEGEGDVWWSVQITPR